MKAADLRHNCNLSRLDSIGKKGLERVEKYMQALALLEEEKYFSLKKGRRIVINKLTIEIATCSKCESAMPFCFEIKNQRVMIITASSNLQANYLPLTHLRFLRNLLYYLFGLEGASEDGLIQFIDEDGIYWTSYNKCFDREFYKATSDRYKMEKFSRSTCGETFIQKEYNEVNPDYVVVMGAATCDAVQRLVEKGKLKVNCPIEYCQYFYMEPDEEKINRIRTQISELLGTPRVKQKFNPSATKTTATNSKVHLNFQSNIYRDISSILDGEFYDVECENEVEKYWIQNVVTPLRLRYYRFLEIWSSLESAVKASFMNIYEANKKGNIDYSDFLNTRGWFFSNWRKYLEIKGKRQLIPMGERLYYKGDLLRRLRNSIVHNSGRLTIADAIENGLNSEILGSNELGGILLFPNLIYITEDGMQQIKDFYDLMIEFLILLD